MFAFILGHILDASPKIHTALFVYDLMVVFTDFVILSIFAASFTMPEISTFSLNLYYNSFAILLAWLLP
jgi:hypothetical protein